MKSGTKTQTGTKTPNKKSLPKSLQGSVINNDLKKYQNDPVVLKKMERAIETLRKVGYL